MQELTLPIVGIDFPNTDKAKTNRRSELMMTLPGEPLELRLEPKNPHDEHAVAVFSGRGIQVGYLPADRAVYVGGRMKRGEEAVAILQGLVDTGAFARIRFGGDAPTLPPATVAAPSQQSPTPRRRSPPIDPHGFYPDPDGPEWGA